MLTPEEMKRLAELEAYVPKPPVTPIPSYAKDCFGLLCNPKIAECARCKELQTCFELCALRTKRAENEVFSRQ